MNKATPIPDTLEERPGFLDCATCLHCGGHITRTRVVQIESGGYPWWHVINARVICGEKK